MSSAHRTRNSNSKLEDTTGEASKKVLLGEKRQNKTGTGDENCKKQRLEDGSGSSSSSNKKTNDKVKDLAIGIDLGTTYSCVGIFQRGKVEIIANDQGNRTTPSYVAFTKEENMLIGDAAKVQATRNLRNTIFDSKRLIGRKFDDATIQSNVKNWPFEIVEENNKPKIKVGMNGRSKTFVPEEISAMILGKMKETAELYLGEPVTKAVITVPAYFTDAQRQATKDAAAIAQLEVLRIINEPTAAALAYGLEQKIAIERKVLIFDLGGGTFDVSILNIGEGVFEVISTAGDTHLGGEDFDNRMVNYCLEKFRRKHKLDLTENKKVIRRLKADCEQAKRTLSCFPVAYVNLLHEGRDFEISFTRARFEELNADLFQKTLELVKKAIRDADISKEEIEEVVLVGGSTRIPKVQNLLQDFFNGKKLCKSINPDEAVAYGAAIQAAILSGDTSKEVQDLVLVDVTPLSLGVQITDNKMSVVVKRNTIIPTKHVKFFTTSYDYQTDVIFPIYEGEYPDTRYNNLLGEFELRDIPPLPKGHANMDVTFDINADGILNVTAVEESTGEKNGITLTYNKNGLSQTEIEEMAKKAELLKSLLAAKNSFETFCTDLQSSVVNTTLKDVITKDDKILILQKCHETIKWLRSNDSSKREEVVSKHKEFEDAFKSILAMAKYANNKEERYCVMLNLEKEPTESQISKRYRDAAKKYHPDKSKGDKDITVLVFRLITAAKKYLISRAKAKKRNDDASK